MIDVVMNVQDQFVICDAVVFALAVNLAAHHSEQLVGAGWMAHLQPI